MLTDFYREKLALFEELNRLSLEMSSISHERLLNDDQAMDSFYKLVERREQLMVRIDELSLKISKIEAEDTRDSVLELQRSLREHGEAIEESNKMIESTVKTALQALKKKAKKLQEGKQTHRAYAGRAVSIEGAFIDKRR